MTASKAHSSRPGPGETRTTIVVWHIDDPAKKADPRYWWDEVEAARVRETSPDTPDLTGRPRGSSVTSLLRRSGGGEVGFDLLVLPDGRETETIRVPLRHFNGSDPERTFVIVAQMRSPTEQEREEIRARGLPWPPEVEALRKEWRGALAAEDNERAAELSVRLKAALAEHGFMPSSLPTLLDGPAVEIQPGVFLQDQRPARDLDKSGG